MPRSRQKAVPFAKVRNIGIMAHIDAGKTTVTERVLYYSGLTHKMGEVDEGTAVTDWMPEEQRRGITITAAAITFPWRDHRLNLIDTPGHVDFTAEVERSCRVLDGAVVVLCGVGGVEAQTETVWRQADKYGVSRIAFVNKLDRIGSDFSAVVQALRERLGTNPLVLQVPIGRERDFRGVVDLLDMKALLFDEAQLGANPTVDEVPPSLRAECKRRREELIETVAEMSDPIMEQYLDGREIPAADLRAAIRSITIQAAGVPVLCGSALRYKGIQPLLNAICDYLPSPADMPPVEGRHPKTRKPIKRKPQAKEPFTALAFKTSTDRYDALTYIRVYSGTFRMGARTYNPREDKHEIPSRIYRMYANRRDESLTEIGPGDIVAVLGLSRTVTGDTLCDARHPAVLERMAFPATVISMAIEPRTQADKGKLLDALKRLAREDPTFETGTDPDTGQLVISGMGELHLEVLKHRIREEFNVDANVGPPRVSYRETIAEPIEQDADFIQQSGGRGHFARVRIRVEPRPGSGEIEFESRLRHGELTREYTEAVQEGVLETARGGAVIGYPMIGFSVALLSAQEHPVDSSPLAFEAAASIALRRAAEAAGVVLLEPVMALEVAIPSAHLGDVINDLQSRRADIREIGDRGNLKIIQARCPLAEMFGYATVVRSLTQGRGTHTMEPCMYSPAPQKVRERLLM